MADRRETTRIARYALYDAGNSNYDTLVVALAFPVFLGAVLEGSAGRADLAWGILFTVATLCAAVLGPMLGGLADRRRAKFRLLRFMTVAAVAGTLLLALGPSLPLLPGTHPGWVAAVFLGTQVCFFMAALLYNSALADVSTRQNAAWISSVAWGVGYMGGIGGLLLAWLAHRMLPPEFRLRAFFLIAAVLFLLFSLPLMLMRPKRIPAEAIAAQPVGLLRIIRSFMGNPTRSRLFWAYFFYTNAVNTVILFTARFAKTTMGFDLISLVKLFILMNLVAAPASIIIGRLAGRFGQIRTLIVVVSAWLIVVFLIAWIGSVQNRTAFIIVASCAASLIGPVQALSRSLFRIIFPEQAMSSYFGVQSLANRSAALVGPLLFGLVSWATKSQILGAMSSAALFAIGLGLLWTVPREVEQDTGRVE